MKPELLATLRAAGEAATTGPWKVSDAHGLCVATADDDLVADMSPGSTNLPWDGRREDATFIALARNHWGELLDEIERLRICLKGAQGLIADQAAEVEGYWEREERLSLKHRKESDALKARVAKLEAVAEAARDFASQIDRWQAMEDRAALDAALIALDQEASRG